MPDGTAAQPGLRKMPGKSGPRLRDGVMKRGSTWSYVIRVKDRRPALANRSGSADSPPRQRPKPPATKAG